MKKAAIIILLLCLLPLGACASGIKHVLPSDNEHVQKLYAAACELSELNCIGIKAPTIFVTDTNPVLGFFVYGTNVVFVSSGCQGGVADKTMCDGIVVHEMVHYIHDQLNTYPFDFNGCRTEQGAWLVFNKYVYIEGRKDLLRVDWWVDYPKCNRPSQ